MMTPRIRSVKPELFSHEGLFEMEMQYQLPLRIAYIALFTCCDRMGRFRWQPRRLKLDMLPYDNVDISNVLDLFIKHGYIKKYQYQGEFYGCIPSWLRHQYINHREAESELPSIEDSIEEEKIKSNSNKEISSEEVYVADASVTRELCVVGTSQACPEGREKEEKRKGREEKGSIVASQTRQSVRDPQIENVFEHWKVLMDHPNAKLDEKRASIISKALKFGYSVSDLCQAIAGCSYTPHNMGDNDRGQRYDGLHVILRDADQIDRFIHNCKCPPRRQTDADKRSQANVQTLKDWVKKTMAGEVANGTV